jgi:hypothetical protein
MSWRYWESGIRWNRLVSYMPLLLYLHRSSHLFPLNKRLGGPRAGPDAVEERKISCFCLGIEPPVIQSIATHYTDWAIPAHSSEYMWLCFEFEDIRNICVKIIFIMDANKNSTCGNTHRQNTKMQALTVCAGHRNLVFPPLQDLNLVHVHFALKIHWVSYMNYHFELKLYFFKYHSLHVIIH